MENENLITKQNNNKGIIILLVIVIISLLGFIAYDKITNDRQKSNEIINNNDNNINNQTQENSDKEVIYNYTQFTSKELTIDYNNGKYIKFTQAKGADQNSGLEIQLSEDMNMGFQVDVNYHYDVVSIGYTSNNNTILIGALMSDSNNDLKLYYATIDKSYLNDDSIVYKIKGEKIMESFKELNTNIVINSIGLLNNDFSISSNNEYYLLDSNGNLIKK